MHILPRDCGLKYLNALLGGSEIAQQAYRQAIVKARGERPDDAEKILEIRCGHEENALRLRQAIRRLGHEPEPRRAAFRSWRRAVRRIVDFWVDPTALRALKAGELFELKKAQAAEPRLDGPERELVRSTLVPAYVGNIVTLDAMIGYATKRSWVFGRTVGME